MKQVYLERLAVLHAVQPGVARLRAVELPRVSPLVWIVAPASDQVAAPRNLPTQALVARGRILDEVANGDGHVLESSGGRKIVIQTSMLLEEPSSAALAELARLQGAGFEIRGRVDAQDTQRAAFGRPLHLIPHLALKRGQAIIPARCRPAQRRCPIEERLDLPCQGRRMDPNSDARPHPDSPPAAGRRCALSRTHAGGL